MSHKFFISHYSKDKSIAELFSNALRRITLEQISPWFSSDTTGGQGLQPGDIWFNQILTKITQSKAVVSLLTPNSIDRPWIYFESGIGQALPDCEIIPVCIGVKRDSILPPLGLYQCYQLNDYRSVVEFFSKLLTLFGIKFDEEMSRVVIEKLVADISQISFEKEEKKDENKDSIEKLIESFKSHIDKRFLEVLEKPTYQIVGDNLNLKIDEGGKNKKSEIEPSYSVTFDVDFEDFKNDSLYIDIRPSDTFQTVTNTLFFMLSNYVKPFRYLEEWVIIEKDTNMHVIIREVGEMIPATSIFKPDTKWKIIKLENPYSALDSSERIRG
ncbi:MAG: toll/interleukin-1 receptor domain-containing protein [Bacteroidetes bacterium]|nr:toll/interleukin-1 receptor domain-containing protein [Bacteroidota bacterium]